MPALFHFDPSHTLFDPINHSSHFPMLQTPENGPNDEQGQVDGANGEQSNGGDESAAAVAVSTAVDTSAGPAYPPDHSMDSIHSLLAASQQLAASAHNQWNPDAAAAAAAENVSGWGFRGIVSGRNVAKINSCHGIL
ncbi:hypothetical protein FRB94_000621 [Tulasnella sp. JGI-2019a]|nr:hypothetical protein FRB93_011945 [Tulasnella sp. JGI-2019a]KAG8988526.1 hypothetical protein FRB94_000621 [Tulasnella sp. JGI-2019a]